MDLDGKDGWKYFAHGARGTERAGILMTVKTPMWLGNTFGISRSNPQVFNFSLD